MSKHIVVAGDVLWDESIVKSAATGLRDSAPVPRTVSHREPGGAWFLAGLIGECCSGLAVEIEAPPQNAETGSAGQAFYSWAPFEQASGARKMVWRTEQFLGYQAPSNPADAAAPDGHATPDLLVIDDLGLGFRDCTQTWPSSLGPNGAPDDILLKTAAPVAQGALWEALLTRFADRLTVVLGAASLRSRPAPLSQAVSWDMSVEETVREIESGISAHDLGRARRVIVHFGVSGAAVFSRTGADSNVRFERFFYHPEDLEGAWEAKRPGAVFGTGSLVAAAAARYLLDPEAYPLYLAMGRSLAAARANRETGGGPVERFSATAGSQAAAAVLSAPLAAPEPAAAFYAAFPHALLERATSGPQSDLLADCAGPGLEYLLAKGTEVVLRGAKDALAAAPKARYGKYLTVDREEIERINGVRNLIRAYLANAQDRRPLSLAVFGPPGSGKSFAIKQLAVELFGSGPLTMEFNLSQFDSAGTEELHNAFHRVRDGSVRGQVPLVFWDEFDSDDLRWLKEFLAPMQDAEFRSHGAIYPFGKAIFVFAGGTCSEFDRFNRTAAAGEEGERFRARKGPDFVSRLRGFVNIKGPNPIRREGTSGADDDIAHVIRRAIIFRSTLERLGGHLIDPSTRMAAVAPSIIEAFLRVDRFIHGARSLEAVVSMSNLGEASQFGPAELPPESALSIHVTPDFRRHLDLGQLSVPVIEALAEACHTAWLELKSRSGEAHPLLRPYRELSDADKERSRATARLTRAKLLSAGYRIVESGVGGAAVMAFSAAEREKLMRLEHEIWMRDRLLRGYAHSAVTDDRLRLHRDVAPFDALAPEDRELDGAIVDSIPVALRKHGFALAAVLNRGAAG